MTSITSAADLTIPLAALEEINQDLMMFRLLIKVSENLRLILKNPNESIIDFTREFCPFSRELIKYISANAIIKKSEDTFESFEEEFQQDLMMYNSIKKITLASLNLLTTNPCETTFQFNKRFCSFSKSMLDYVTTLTQARTELFKEEFYTGIKITT